MVPDRRCQTQLWNSGFRNTVDDINPASSNMYGTYWMPKALGILVVRYSTVLPEVLGLLVSKVMQELHHQQQAALFLWATECSRQVTCVELPSQPRCRGNLGTGLAWAATILLCSPRSGNQFKAPAQSAGPSCVGLKLPRYPVSPTSFLLVGALTIPYIHIDTYIPFYI